MSLILCTQHRLFAVSAPLVRCSLTQPKPEVLRGFPGSGRRFLAMDGRFVLVATARDPGIYEYAGAMRQATNNHASGKQRVDKQEH